MVRRPRTASGNAAAAAAAAADAAVAAAAAASAAKQAHPNKKLAEKLHAERPDLYADDNHKPEMAVTLSDFEALCGFRPFQEIIWNLHFYPELRALVSLDAIHQVQVFMGTHQQLKTVRPLLIVIFNAEHPCGQHNSS